MSKFKSMINREGGYVEYGVIMILILVSITIISYLQLTQTNIAFSVSYQKETQVNNELFSAGNELQSSTKKAIEELFNNEAIFDNNASPDTHLTIDLSNAKGVEIHDIESFDSDNKGLNEYFNFTSFDYYTEISNLEKGKAFTFIREYANENFILTGDQNSNPLLPEHEKYAYWGVNKLTHLNKTTTITDYQLKSRPLEFVTIYMNGNKIVEVERKVEQFVFLHKENIITNPVTNEFITVVYEMYYAGNQNISKLKGLEKVKRNL